MQPLPLNERLDRIGHHIVRARLFMDLWFFFEGKPTRHNIIDAMQEYEDFFRFTQHAYLATYVIYISGVFDKRRDTISLENLFRDMKKSVALKSLDAAAVQGLLNQAKPVANRVAILRNNAFAHRSANCSYNDAFRLAGVTPNELRDLTDTALEILNQMRVARELQVKCFVSRPREVAQAMMEALEQARNMYEQGVERD